MLSYLSEKGYLDKGGRITAEKRKQASKRATKKDDDTEVLDTMITSLVELLEEKGYITQEQWVQKIKKNLKG